MYDDITDAAVTEYRDLRVVHLQQTRWRNGTSFNDTRDKRSGRRRQWWRQYVLCLSITIIGLCILWYPIRAIHAADQLEPWQDTTAPPPQHMLEVTEEGVWEEGQYTVYVCGTPLFLGKEVPEPFVVTHGEGEELTRNNLRHMYMEQQQLPIEEDAWPPTSSGIVSLSILSYTALLCMALVPLVVFFRSRFFIEEAGVWWSLPAAVMWAGGVVVCFCRRTSASPFTLWWIIDLLPLAFLCVMLLVTGGAMEELEDYACNEQSWWCSRKPSGFLMGLLAIVLLAVMHFTPPAIDMSTVLYGLVVLTSFIPGLVLIGGADDVVFRCAFFVPRFILLFLVPGLLVRPQNPEMALFLICSGFIVAVYLALVGALKASNLHFRDRKIEKAKTLAYHVTTRPDKVEEEPPCGESEVSATLREPFYPETGDSEAEPPNAVGQDGDDATPPQDGQASSSSSSSSCDSGSEDAAQDRHLELPVKEAYVRHLGALLEISPERVHEDLDDAGPLAIQVARYGGLEEMRLILDQGAWVDARGLAGETALMWAAQEGREDMVQLLLAREADACAVDSQGQTALLLATGQRHPRVAALLLEATMPPQDDHGTSVHCGTTSLGDDYINRLSLLLEQHPTMLEESDEPPLVLEAEAGNVEAVRLFLAHGAAINERDSFGRTALIAAAAGGHSAVVELLLSASGCDIDLRVESEGSALTEAARHGHAPVVLAFLQNGAAISPQDTFLITQLARCSGSHGGAASSSGGGSQASKDSDDGGGTSDQNPDPREASGGEKGGSDNDGRGGRESSDGGAEDDGDVDPFPLHTAARQGAFIRVRWLLEQGRDPRIRNLDGKTARDVATGRSVRVLLRVAMDSWDEHGNGDCVCEEIGSVVYTPSIAAPSIRRGAEWKMKIAREIESRCRMSLYDMSDRLYGVKHVPCVVGNDSPAMVRVSLDDGRPHQLYYLRGASTGLRLQAFVDVAIKGRQHRLAGYALGYPEDRAIALVFASPDQRVVGQSDQVRRSSDDQTRVLRYGEESEVDEDDRLERERGNRGGAALQAMLEVLPRVDDLDERDSGTGS